MPPFDDSPFDWGSAADELRRLDFSAIEGRITAHFTQQYLVRAEQRGQVTLASPTGRSCERLLTFPRFQGRIGYLDIPVEEPLARAIIHPEPVPRLALHEDLSEPAPDTRPRNDMTTEFKKPEVLTFRTWLRTQLEAFERAMHIMAQKPNAKFSWVTGRNDLIHTLWNFPTHRLLAVHHDYIPHCSAVDHLGDAVQLSHSMSFAGLDVPFGLIKTKEAWAIIQRYMPNEPPLHEVLTISEDQVPSIETLTMHCAGALQVVIASDIAYSHDTKMITQLGVPTGHFAARATPTWGVPVDMDEPIWHMRERSRLEAGRYSKLPQTVLDSLDPEKIKTKFPHLALKPGNIGMIEFTASEAAGALDRQQVMKAGRFIRQYGRDYLSDNDVKYLAAHIMGAFPFKVELTVDRETVKRIYCEGPESCMGKGSESATMNKFTETYEGGDWIHPAEVYCHPESDMALAYVVGPDDVIGARTWINTEDKTWVRIYDNPQKCPGAKAMMQAWLEENGYKHDQSAFHGQKLLRIETYSGRIICPYIDYDNMGVDIYPTYLKAGGDHSADHETGCLQSAEEYHDWHCAHCDHGFSDDDDSGTTVSGDSICEDCRDASYTQVYDLDEDEVRYILDSDADSQAYDAEHFSGSCQREERLYASSLADHGLVELNSHHYDEMSRTKCCVAVEDECTPYNGGEYVLTEHIDELDLVVVDGEAYDKEDVLLEVDQNGTITLVFHAVAPLFYTQVDPDDYDLDIKDEWEGIEVYAHNDFIATYNEEVA